MKHTFMKWGNTLLDLLYPPICPCCDLPIGQKENVFCIKCKYYLKETDLHLYSDNLFTRHFWGRINIKSGASMLLYQKGGRVQKLIKKIKYEHRKDLAFIIGVMYGRLLNKTKNYQGIDLIVPVPIHPNRLKSRGYNQSLWFAKGLAKSMSIQINDDSLQRLKSSKSQTKKNRLQRNQHLQNAFTVINNDPIKNKHILLVDDVLTTGATLESCGNKLIGAGISELSMITIAIGLS